MDYLDYVDVFENESSDEDVSDEYVMKKFWRYFIQIF